MYGKLFTQIYDGTLCTKGPWQTLVTFQQFIILADKDGVVDMTPEAVSRRTTIPLEIIQTGVAALEAPDPESRTPDEDGRRITRLSDAREWGWKIVNYAHYRALRTAEERRTYHREYAKQRPKKSADVENVEFNKSTSIQQNQPIAYAEAKAEETKALSDKSDGERAKAKELRSQASEILAFLNLKANRAFRPVPANIDLIVARLKTGITVGQCKQVIAKKTREWSARPEMESYLRPETLFGATKMEQYIGELTLRESA